NGRLALEGRAIPYRTVRGRLVGALHEGEERRVGVAAAANRRVREDELAERCVEARRHRPRGRVSEALRLRIGVGVEDGLPEAGVPGPEAGAADLVRVRLARDPVRHVGNAARMRRRGAAGEAGHGEIEAAPEEVHRAALANEAGPEDLEHPVDLDEGKPEA